MAWVACDSDTPGGRLKETVRSEEHTSELQSQSNLVCRLLLETTTVQEREDKTRPVDEETPPDGRYESEYVRMKFEAESMALEANQVGVMATILVSHDVVAQAD